MVDTGAGTNNQVRDHHSSCTLCSDTQPKDSEPLTDWEKVLEKDVDELRRELNIEQPPDLREIRKMIRRQQKQEKERLQQQQMQQ